MLILGYQFYTSPFHGINFSKRDNRSWYSRIPYNRPQFFWLLLYPVTSEVNNILFPWLADDKALLTVDKSAALSLATYK